MHRTAMISLRASLRGGTTRNLVHTGRRGASSTAEGVLTLRRRILSKDETTNAANTASKANKANRANPAAHGPDMAARAMRSSVYFRRAPAPFLLVSILAGFGAWYSYGPITNQRSLIHQFTKGAATVIAAEPANAVPTRKILVVGADGVQTGTIIGEGPVLKTNRADGRNVVEMMTPDQATNALRQSEQSFLVNRGDGVVRYDVAQLPSNDPIEDDHAEQIVEVPDAQAPGSKSDWMFWGMFDGHRGWATSAKLRQTLINTVANELNETYTAANGAIPAAEDIDTAIKNGFIRLDDEIVHKSVEKVFATKSSKSLAAEMLAPAHSGSCALLSFYDTRSRELRVACAGDSRAVLGRRSNNGKWTATPLSADQTGSSPDEIARLRREHPFEPDVVRVGRVLGLLEPTRAFGDATYKWTRELAHKLKKAFFFTAWPPSAAITPPYVTAEPVVTTTKVQPEKGDFLVMATDGLWEMLTNEEVVGLVGKWLEEQGGPDGRRGAAGAGVGTSVWAKMFGGGARDSRLPIEEDAASGSDHKNGQKTPIRRQQWGVAGRNDHFVVKDKNVATHLVRNALGGSDDDLVCSLLTIHAPFARKYRDDLTVQVIFFGRGEATGEVLANSEATAESKVLTKVPS